MLYSKALSIRQERKRQLEALSLHSLMSGNIAQFIHSGRLL